MCDGREAGDQRKADDQQENHHGRRLLAPGIAKKKWRECKRDYAYTKRYDIGPEPKLGGKWGRDIGRAHILPPTCLADSPYQNEGQEATAMVLRKTKGLDA